MMGRLMRRTAFLTLFVAICTACGGADGTTCRVNADCASGVCGADGRCAAPDDAAIDDLDGGTDMIDAGGGAACVPDHDGTLQRDEVPLGPGLMAPYRAAQDVVIDTSGVMNGDGTRSWNLDVALEGDHTLLVETTAVADAWWAADFPDASYASRLSESADLLGVFRVTDDALLLLGVVSPEDGAARTSLAYDPPVTVLQFPFAPGASWSSEADVSGVAQGIGVFYTERYESFVDGRGDLDTPYGTFPVLRVRTVLTRTVGFAVTTIRTFLFVAECFGTVATVVSQDNESDVEFTEASEVRRLEP